MMINDLGDSKVTIKKDELLAAIKANRDKHVIDYEEAMNGYRTASVSKLSRMLKAARDGGAIEVSTGLDVPKDHIKDYDRVIRMLEMSTADAITITEHQFSQYVLDEWDWKARFLGTTSSYSGGSKR